VIDYLVVVLKMNKIDNDNDRVTEKREKKREPVGAECHLQSKLSVIAIINNNTIAGER